MTEKQNLTLYGIETQYLELVAEREAIALDPLMPNEYRDQALAACETAIAEYVKAEMQKCDGIAAYLREFEARAKTYKEESRRCSEMAKYWQGQYDELESRVIGVMQLVKKNVLMGARSQFKLKGNPPSVDVAQPDMVPKEYMRITVTMPYELWSKILFSLPDGPETIQIRAELAAKAKYGEAEPMKSVIAEELKKEGGAVPGCRLIKDKVRLEVK
jgi:Gp157 protein